MYNLIKWRTLQHLTMHEAVILITSSTEQHVKGVKSLFSWNWLCFGTRLTHKNKNFSNQIVDPLLFFLFPLFFVLTCQYLEYILVAVHHFYDPVHSCTCNKNNSFYWGRNYNLWKKLLRRCHRCTIIILGKKTIFTPPSTLSSKVGLFVVSWYVEWSCLL